MKQILLRGGKLALIDDEDFEVLLKYKWYSYKNGYAYAWKKKHKIYMHRLILNPPKEMCVDHINGNKLDNRKANLRICTNAENIRHRTKISCNNRSSVLGVMWDRARQKWRAYITLNRRQIWLGRYNTIEKAAGARRAAERKYFGEFAPIKGIK